MNDTKQLPADGASGPAQDDPSLMLTAAGLCCALGYQLDAVVCALRANMDHFQESQFQDASGHPVRVAMLEQALLGQPRLQRWVEHAVSDCAHFMHDPASLFDPARTALVVLCPDDSRPHAGQDYYGDLTLDAIEALGKQHLKPGQFTQIVMAQGRAGLGAALWKAARTLVEQDFEQVLLIGIDSYLNAADIEHYLAQERLFVSGNSNGFLPGEAACALLLTLAARDTPGLHISGVGIAQEAGRPDGSVPSRAQGLTQAIRLACKRAGMAPDALQFRLSDQNGEQFFAREGSNAFTRVLAGSAKLPHLTIADKIGEVGAAAGPAMLAWLLRDMARADCGPGTIGVAHLANDDGTRCAVILTHHGEQHDGNPRLRQR